MVYSDDGPSLTSVVRASSFSCGGDIFFSILFKLGSFQITGFVIILNLVGFFSPGLVNMTILEDSLGFVDDVVVVDVVLLLLLEDPELR